jgi:hypothetical protein
MGLICNVAPGSSLLTMQHPAWAPGPGPTAAAAAQGRAGSGGPTDGPQQQQQQQQGDDAEEVVEWGDPAAAGSGGYRSIKITLGPAPSRHMQGAGAAGDAGEGGRGGGEGCKEGQ